MKIKWISTEPILFIYCVISTTTMTILPQLILDKVCIKIIANVSACAKLDMLSKEHESQIQKEASRWVMYVFLCSTIPSLFSVIYCGILTNLYGRKKTLITIPILSSAQNLIFLLTAIYLRSSNAFLLIGALCVSTFGDIQGVISLCYSHIAHITTNEKRTSRLAILESCLFLAPALAGISTGYLVSYTGYWAVFMFSLCCNAILFVYIMTFYENINKNYEDEVSLIESRHIPAVNPFISIKSLFEHLAEKGQHALFAIFLIILYLLTCGLWTETFMVALYLKNSTFYATAAQIGLFISLTGVIRGIGVVFLTQLSHRCLSFSDSTLIIIGILSHILTYVSIGASRSIEIIFMCSISSSFIPVAMTASRSMMTKLISSKHNNAIISIGLTLDVLSSVTVSFAGLQVYYYTLEFYSGTIFFIIAGFDFLALILFLISQRISMV